MEIDRYGFFALPIDQQIIIENAGKSRRKKIDAHRDNVNCVY